MNKESFYKAIKLNKRLEKISDLINIVNEGRLVIMHKNGSVEQDSDLNDMLFKYKSNIYNSLHSEQNKIEQEIDEL